MELLDQNATQTCNEPDHHCDFEEKTNRLEMLMTAFSLKTRQSTMNYYEKINRPNFYQRLSQALGRIFGILPPPDYSTVTLTPPRDPKGRIDLNYLKTDEGKAYLRAMLNRFDYLKL